jgi:hypothetical protein
MAHAAALGHPSTRASWSLQVGAWKLCSLQRFCLNYVRLWAEWHGPDGVSN